MAASPSPHVAEAVLDNEALSPPAKRRAVGTMLEATSISERRACALVGLSRDSWRHPPLRAQHDQAMSRRIVDLAHENVGALAARGPAGPQR